MVLAFCHVGVEGITQAITHEVEAEHCQENEQAWNDNEPGGNIKKALTITDQTTPARVWRLNTKAIRE